MVALLNEMATARPAVDAPNILDIEDLNVYYGAFHAVGDVTFSVPKNQITALIGPSGCGKSTVLRCINRMNDLVPEARVEGSIEYHGIDINGNSVDPVEVRRHIGMVFQKPNPFPKSIYDNIAWGAKINGYKGNMDELVERCLRQAALWGEVHDKLHESGLALSGGQQQRLCIARTLAINPDVILMDEPCSALDPTSTRRIEETIADLRGIVTVVIVTHNMQQAHRVSDTCAFFLAAENEPGRVIEQGPTERMFSSPDDPRTLDYVSGRFG
jgi:phosphate transport system ATP-binding protein